MKYEKMIQSILKEVGGQENIHRISGDDGTGPAAVLFVQCDGAVANGAAPCGQERRQQHDDRRQGAAEEYGGRPVH